MQEHEVHGSRGPLDQAWESAMRRIAAEMGEWARNAYLGSLEPVELEGSVFIIGTPNEFARTRLEERYGGLFARALSDELQQSVHAKFVMVPNQRTVDPPPAPADQPPAAPMPVASRDAPPEFASLALNSRYTFETFVVGNSNRLAHAAALNVAKNPGSAYNPLFIYGGVGLGKTHMMQAIGHCALGERPRCRLVYISGETFLNHVVTAIRENRTDTFRQWYRSVDLWLVDDIQFIAAREQSRTETEFFHTFNALYETNKQIVISSDRPPRELQIMDDRLRSRFEMGLLTDIKMPDQETRVAILQRKAELEGILVGDEVLTFIALTVQSSVRALEGALTRVIACASLTGSDVSVDLAREWLADYATRNGYHKVSPRQVRDIVARRFGLKPEDLAGKARDQNKVLPRQVAMYLCRKLGDYSTIQIGAAFGGRDHSTVLHSCTKIADLVQTDPEIAALVDDLTSSIQGQVST